jgi:CheY-like chemotaxis protein
VTATNGLEAVAAVRSLMEEGGRTGGRRQFDMMLTDVLMPLMDGLQAAAAIRQLEYEFDLPEIPMLALTGMHALLFLHSQTTDIILWCYSKCHVT